ncbi:MAG TPA: hypothetical protein VH597_16525 [Verrucomicrobiae bacterium]|jgi:hypothetical protein|nr:hypothetical protein [Verrucomicrobiae bacterium]
MKTAFGISILINFVSIGVVIALLAGRSKSISHATAMPATEEIKPEEPASRSQPQTVPAVKSQSFHWNELESDDYRAYIANLRGIECPGQTIRDIITADVDAAIFAPRRQQLKQNQNHHSSGLDAELQELNGEETALIASLLGTKLNTSQVAIDTPTQPRSVRKRPQAMPVALPIAFADLESAGLKLNANQLHEIAELRQSFVDQVGGPNQDPNDPAYRERWQMAQPAVNAELEAMLGTSAYQTLQFESQSAALSPPAPTAKP